MARSHTDLAWEYLTEQRHRHRTVWDEQGNSSVVTDTVTYLCDPTFAAVVLGIARINDTHAVAATATSLIWLGLPRSAVNRALKRLKQFGQDGDGVKVRHGKQGNAFNFRLASK